MSQLSLLLANASRTTCPKLRLGDFDEARIPDSIGELQHLEEIEISRCPNLTHLPNSLSELPRLRKLTITGSMLQELPQTIGNFPALRELIVKGSHLKQLSESLCGLLALSNLTVTMSRLKWLPDSIGALSSLRELVLNNNLIRVLPDSISDLQRLEKLHVSGNWLQDLPESIGRCTCLLSLVVSGNFLTAIPAATGRLSRLQVARFANNRIHTLPQSLTQLTHLQSLDIRGNKALGIPVEVLCSSPTQILEFFFRSARRRQLNEAKILLVGQGGVGKTSLVNRLLDDTFDDGQAKTDGIRVRDWSLGSDRRIRLNVWDFGGQEIMHATHQFFLTKRSLYILVLDARAGERESNIHYWLEMISIYGANSPLIVVLNKSEEHFDQVDENRLRLDYGESVNFHSFHNVSCKTRSGLPLLRNAIETAIKSMSHVSDFLPEDYFAVKEALEAKAGFVDFITESQYAEACAGHGVSDPEEQRRLLRFLHDLGCVLHYDDPDQRYHVHDTRVLNPTWVTGGVYRVLNDPDLLREGSGIVTQVDLQRLLDPTRYPQHRYSFFVDIMRKYELCIAFSDNANRVLVPELLSKNEPDVGWSRRGQSDTLEFEYHYTVLPRGLVPRFIVRVQHLLTANRTLWRAGAVLNIEECRVLVRGDLRRARVHIQVQGPKDNRRRALAVVRDAFEAVHSSYGNLNAEPKVLLPNDPDAPPVDYRHLLKLEKQGVVDYYFEKARQPYHIGQLLDGIDLRNFDAFLSYNSKDKLAVRELAELLRTRGVRCWFDEQQLRPGHSWQREISGALRDCQAVVVILGSKGVGPWEEEESALALDYAAKGKKLVIPVLLPNAPQISDLPPQFAFLSSRTWADMRDGFDPSVISRLTDAILDRRLNSP